MDPPLVGGLQLKDNSFVDESRESLFENPSGCERLDGGALSLDRDLRGGIGEGLDKHVAMMQHQTIHTKFSSFLENVPNDVASPTTIGTCLFPSPFLRENRGDGDCLHAARNFGA